MIPKNLNQHTWSFKVLIVISMLSLLGIAVSPLLHLKLIPQEVEKKLTIRFYYPGYKAEELEREISSRIEGMAAKLDGVEEIESHSYEGWGSIWLSLDEKSDLKSIRFLMSTAIRQAWESFPGGMAFPEISNRNYTNENESLLSYRITGETDITSLKELVNNRLKPFFTTIEGVEEVRTDGLYQQEVHIILQEKLLKETGISDKEVQAVLRHYGRELYIHPGGYREEDTHHPAPFKLTSPLEQYVNPEGMIVAKKENRLVRLSDVAKIVLKEGQSKVRYRVNGQRSIYLQVYARPDVNQLSLARKIRKATRKVEAGLPAWASLRIASDSTKYVRAELKKIGIRTLVTLLLLFVAVLLIYRDRVYLVVIFLSFLVNISMASMLYYLLGLEIHFFALAGITLSLGMMIDNSIIVIDAIRNRGNRKVLLPLVTATLTTIGALLSLYLAPVAKEAYWDDFIFVIVINLAVSLFSSLFFVPALLLRLTKKSTPRLRPARNRWLPYFNRLYKSYMAFGLKHKTLIFIILILCFGLPFYALPNRLNKETQWHRMYNRVFSNAFVQHRLRPYVDKFLGGTLRPFIQNSFDNYQPQFPGSDYLTISFLSEENYPPEILQEQVERIEDFLNTQHPVDLFVTNFFGEHDGTIQVSFLPGANENYPYVLMNDLYDHLSLYGGGSDWSIRFKEQSRSINYAGSRNKLWGFYLYGYDYDQLLQMAREIKKEMLENPLVRNVSIKARYRLFDRSGETKRLIYDFNKDSYSILAGAAWMNQLKTYAAYPSYLYRHKYQGVELPYYLTISEDARNFWSFFHRQGSVQNHPRLATIGTMDYYDSPDEIIRLNQQFQLFLNYDYLSSASLGKKYESKKIEELRQRMPPGFSVAPKSKAIEGSGWMLLLLIIVTLIFFTCSILFESLKQALWVVVMIPFSYIGVFIVFPLFHLNFDQGGFAAFILLGGLTVNASIYMIHSFNTISYKNSLRRYILAWNRMVVPVYITILSTILAFTPFLVGDGADVFWRALAAGTIGGLLFSMLLLFLLLPLGLVKKKDAIKP